MQADRNDITEESEDFFIEEDSQEEGDYSIQTPSDGLFEQYRFVADPGQKLLRVDKFLVCHISQVSRNRIQEAADAGMVQANGCPVKSNYRVKAGDIITVLVNYPPRDTEVIPENIPLDIVYEDEDLMVINKPAGMVVHPGHGNFSGTLVNALVWHFRENPQFEENDPRPGLVHRIDKDTSGLLVVAKNPTAKADLSMQFFHKSTQRTYQALVWGRIQHDEGSIDCPIGRDKRDRLRMAAYPDGEESAKHAVTHYKVLERFEYVTLVECRLETGRTHQIRVHMRHIGHPLFNDERYGGNEILKGSRFANYKQFIHNCFEICPRQALHAQTLGFVHPKSKESLFFSQEMPEDMSRLIEKWRHYTVSRKASENEFIYSDIIHTNLQK